MEISAVCRGTNEWVLGSSDLRVVALLCLDYQCVQCTNDARTLVRKQTHAVRDDRYGYLMLPFESSRNPARSATGTISIDIWL